jgi:hypothetical protein
MEGQDLRQTLVTIGLSIIAADLMLAKWGGLTYQFDPPDWLFGATPVPLINAYPTYRQVLFGVAVVIGLLLWFFLTRTRVGMMIRAGVDDRAMLSASGVNVQLVFAITFAIGAGLAGFAGEVGIAGRGDRWRDGERAGRGHRRCAGRSRRAVRPRLYTDLRHRLHLPDHGVGAGDQAAGNPGSTGIGMEQQRRQTR